MRPFITKEKTAQVTAILLEQAKQRTIQGDIKEEIAVLCGVTPCQVGTIQDKLGILFRSTQFVSYGEARTWARASGISSWKQWDAAQRPVNIPACPDTYYKEWVSWPDFLGKVNIWTWEIILAYFQEIQDFIPNLSDADLLKLLQDKGLLRTGGILGSSSITELLRALRGGDLLKLKSNAGGLHDIQEMEYESPEAVIDVHAADRAASLQVGAEAVQHIIESQLAALRAKWFRDGEVATLIPLFSQRGGKFFQEISRRFQEEVTAVESLATPWWDLHKNGKAVAPSPMQKYVAWRLKKDRVLRIEINVYRVESGRP